MKKIKRNIMLCIILIPIILLVFFGIPQDIDYVEMAYLSIGGLCFSIFFVCAGCKIPFFSMVTFFLVASWFFHCGQICKLAFEIEGDVPLDFRYYGSETAIQEAFSYYILSQIFILIGIVICGIGKKKNTISEQKPTEYTYKKIAKYLLCVGVLPRVYIDFSGLVAGINGGYEGVYKLYFPQILQTIAFFFDAGVFFLLFAYKNTRKKDILFWVVVLYKVLMMITGSRQERVVFLVVWAYIYYFVIQKTAVGQIVKLAIIAILGLKTIDIIGDIRFSDGITMELIVKAINSDEKNTLLGDSMGEFGSAFSTLVAAFQYTPSYENYGVGKSYMAGVLSIIPMLISQIPALSDASLFVRQYPGNIYFALGGSYIGESYYNFSWFGVFISMILGYCLARCQKELSEDPKSHSISTVWAAVVSTALILFVRGYFTDMVQKLFWLWIMILVITKKIKIRS